MIENTHLRPGNLVCTGKKDDGSDEIGRVAKVECEEYADWNGSWDNDGIPIIINGEVWTCDELYPIRLTEEWLTKLGFVEEEGQWYLNSDNDLFFCGIEIVEPWNAPGVVHIWVNFGENMEGVIDAYVHTLQNLFWGFTGGKDLKIKE